MRKKTNQEKAQAQRTKSEQDKREAQRIIRRVEQESEQVGTSAMARSSNKMRDHFMGEENPKDDWVEIWGKRIGRAFSVVLFIYLSWSLYTTYIAPQ